MRDTDLKGITRRSLLISAGASVEHPDPSSYAKKFSGKYAHRTITGGIWHNLPHEAPEAFAGAVIDVSGW